MGVAATFVHAAEWGHGDLGEAQHINNNPLWSIPCHHNYDALLMHTHLNMDKKFAYFPFLSSPSFSKEVCPLKPHTRLNAYTDLLAVTKRSNIVVINCQYKLYRPT